MSVRLPPPIGLLRGELLDARELDASRCSPIGEPSSSSPSARPSPSWWLEAACRGRDQRWWFAHGDSFEAAVAVSICRRCVVRAACLADALAHDDTVAPAGIFGGLTPRQRQRLRRRQLAG